MKRSLNGLSKKGLLNDERISHIEILVDEGKYLVWLNDGYVMDDGSHVFCASSVKEINECLCDVEKEVKQ